MYDIVFKNRKVESSFSNLADFEQKRIRDALESLKPDPRRGEKLTGTLNGHWSERVSDSVRIIYRIEGNLIVVEALGPHTVYEELERYLRSAR